MKRLILSAIAITAISVLIFILIREPTTSYDYLQVPETGYELEDELQIPDDENLLAYNYPDEEDIGCESGYGYNQNECDYNEEPEPYFYSVFTNEPLPEHIIEFITGRSFREYAPFTTDFLAYLTVTHVDFDGNDRIGHLIVAAEIGDEVLEIFQEIYESRFPIYSIRLIDYFDAVDYYSLAANNSSAFNFRYIANTNVISRHGFGMAIDINPIQNPYVRGDNVLPEAGRAYLDRSDIRPGMIVPGSPVYEAFISRGWIWGGNWTSLRDYHHFELRR